jgi:Peptidase family S41
MAQSRVLSAAAVVAGLIAASMLFAFGSDVGDPSASDLALIGRAIQLDIAPTVMGTPSFGKGSVQTIIPLKGNGALRLTTALYYTPS